MPANLLSLFDEKERWKINKFMLWPTDAIHIVDRGSLLHQVVWHQQDKSKKSFAKYGQYVQTQCLR